ncbi:CsgG/HfaB family protein [Billgrantia gudaonensis]|uniref:Curli production assembly/transport component CsgG n=1 Tax=Billgrantia gudaonensis TaxID=376427 RepID=A0A1G8T2P6_9GAMM|nr:CsgG/HfaB family protein [Halomonas gudaonensis]SDJ34910.1 Curli production assembly/transport component CsgG [Halomonas gudaonensis]
MGSFRTTLRLLLWLLVAALPLTAQGGLQTRVVQAEATGVDREEAIFNALGEAVRQVHGAQVDASRELRRSMNRLSVRDGDGREASVTHESQVENGTKVRSQGLISGYDVLEVAPAPGGGQLARLEVRVPVYRVPGAGAQSNRRRLAVYPVEIDTAQLRLGGETLATGDVSARLTQSLVQALVGSRRFNVLDRDMQQAIRAEQAFVASGRVPLAEKAMLGRNLGADYLVVTRLTELDMVLREVANPITGERSHEGDGVATLEARVVIPATGQIMWSHTLSTDLAELGIDSPANGGFAQRVFDALGSELTFRALNVIYPVRVVESRGNEIVLNQGGVIVKPGQRWAVYDIGKTYSDPYHGESLGPRESWVADVDITRVADKVAHARIVSGAVEGNGQVLRRVDATGKATREAEREAVRGTRERVCLPMDPC